MSNYLSIKDVAEDHRIEYIAKQLQREPSKAECLLFYPTFDLAFSDGVEWARKNLTVVTQAKALLEEYKKTLNYMRDIEGKSKSPDAYMIVEANDAIEAFEYILSKGQE